MSCDIGHRVSLSEGRQREGGQTLEISHLWQEEEIVFDGLVSISSRSMLCLLGGANEQKELHVRFSVHTHTSDRKLTSLQTASSWR